MGKTSCGKRGFVIKPNRSIVVALVASVIVFVFAWLIWPTPYRYFTLHEPAIRPARVQRFTGQTEVLTLYGWVSPTERRQSRLVREFDSLTQAKR